MRSSKRHPLVSVQVPPAELELAQLRLWELGATGLEEQDETTLARPSRAGQVTMMAAFPDEATARHACEELRESFDSQLVYVPHEDWAIEWRRGFGPRRIGRRLLLHPSWQPVESGPGDVVVTIDPENAFGSGDHETTRLVLQVLEQRITGGERVLDVGCGSGVLSIAALRLGAASAVAIDIDDDAVAVARRNAKINQVAGNIEVSSRALTDLDGLYEVVLANIQTRALTEMPSDLQERVAPRGILVLSGILREEQAELLVAYERMRVTQIIQENAWCACVLKPVER